MSYNKRIRLTLVLLFIVVLSISLAACGSSQKTRSDNQNNNQTTNEVISPSQSENESSNENSAAVNDDIPSEPKTHTEYVITYFVYAEKGAEITWYDPQTGQFSYKDKCETCGQISGGEHSGGLYVSGSSKYNAGFTCTNSSCSMWGKSQRVVIACSESGEWVEVYD